MNNRIKFFGTISMKNLTGMNKKIYKDELTPQHSHCNLFERNMIVWQSGMLPTEKMSVCAEFEYELNAVTIRFLSSAEHLFDNPVIVR